MPPVPESRNATNGAEVSLFCAGTQASLPSEDEVLFSESGEFCEVTQSDESRLSEETEEMPATSVSKKRVERILAGRCRFFRRFLAEKRAERI